MGRALEGPKPGMKMAKLLSALRNVCACVGMRTSIYCMSRDRCLGYHEWAAKRSGPYLCVHARSAEGRYGGVCNTVNFGYNDVPLGKKKRSLYAKCHYIRSTQMMVLCIQCVYGCRIWCMSYMRDMTYHTFVHMYNVIYLRTCGCTVCLRTTLSCFSRAHALSVCLLGTSQLMCRQFSSMAMLKVSN